MAVCGSFDKEYRGSACGKDEWGKGGASGIDVSGKGGAGGIDEEGKGGAGGMDEDGKGGAGGMFKGGRGGAGGIENVFGVCGGLGREEKGKEGRKEVNFWVFKVFTESVSLSKSCTNCLASSTQFIFLINSFINFSCPMSCIDEEFFFSSLSFAANWFKLLSDELRRRRHDTDKHLISSNELKSTEEPMSLLWRLTALRFSPKLNPCLVSVALCEPRCK